MRAGDDELAVMADGKCPDFAVVALKFLNVFELQLCVSVGSTTDHLREPTLSPSQYLSRPSLPTLQK